MQVLVFGSKGHIGSSICAALASNHSVVEAPRELKDLRSFEERGNKYDAVIWAQGKNASSSILEFERNRYLELLESNVLVILESIKHLLTHDLVANPSQFVILGSMWSQVARINKADYASTKSSLTGICKSLAVELAPMGVRVNLVSPGPISSPMTSTHLANSEMQTIISQTPLKELTRIESVVNLICALAQGEFASITGQEIVVDGGFSIARYF